MLGHLSFSCRFFPPRIRVIRRTSDQLIYIYISIQMFSYESRALWTRFGGLRASWPLGPIWLENTENTAPAVLSALRPLENTAPAVLWPLVRSQGPARCPGGARMGCSSPLSVPPRRSKVLLEPQLSGPRALEGAARASIWCPRALKGAAPASTRCHRCARRGCSSLLGAPCARTTGH